MIVFIFLVVFLRRLAVNPFMQNVLYVQPVQQALKMSVSRKLMNQVNIMKNKFRLFYPDAKLESMNAIFMPLGYFNISNKLYCEPHARAAKAAEQLGQQTAASIRAAASSPSAALSHKSQSPIQSQPNIPQGNNIQVRKD